MKRKKNGLGAGRAVITRRLQTARDIRPEQSAESTIIPGQDVTEKSGGRTAHSERNENALHWILSDF